MAFKIVLDANVLMDFALTKREDHEAAQSLFEAIAGRRLQACTTPAIIHMVSYFLRKEKPSPWIRSWLASLIDYIEIIELNHLFAVQAIHSKFADLEDALQYYAALQHRCTHFISSDKNFQKAASTQLPVLTAHQFLQLLS